MGACWSYIFWMLTMTVCIVFYMCLGSLLNYRMRYVITRHIERKLFASRITPYNLVVLSGLDNYDQRLTDDLQTFLNLGFGQLFGNISLNPPLYFSIIMAVLSFKNAVEYLHDLPIFKDFIMISVASFVGSIVIYTLPMNAVSRTLFAQKRYEGDLRWAHSRSIIHCEAIAFYRGEAQEKKLADERFARCYFNAHRYYWIASCLYGTSQCCVSLASAFQFLFLYFGKVGAADVFTVGSYLQNGFTSALGIPNQYQQLSFTGGACHRVGGLIEELDRLIAADEPHDLAGKEESLWKDGHAAMPAAMPASMASADTSLDAPLLGQHHSGGGGGNCSVGDASANTVHTRLLTVNGLTAFAPSRSTGVKVGAQTGEWLATVVEEPACLFSDFQLEVHEGQSVVVTGPSGCAKTALLHCIAGLWQRSDGTIIHHHQQREEREERGLFYLPQRAYVTTGSLFQNVLYPDIGAAAGDGIFHSEEEASGPVLIGGRLQRKKEERVEEVLRAVKLWHLKVSFGLHGTPPDWSTVLSGGERQRLAFARLLYHRPKFALLDEATSAVDSKTEEAMYALLPTMQITVIAVVQRRSVQRPALFPLVLSFKPSSGIGSGTTAAGESGEADIPTYEARGAVVGSGFNGSWHLAKTEETVGATNKASPAESTTAIDPTKKAQGNHRVITPQVMGEKKPVLMRAGTTDFGENQEDLLVGDHPLPPSGAAAGSRTSKNERADPDSDTAGTLHTCTVEFRAQ
jgi:ABC-type uncharacterized transport system fused permease/ATPase subunit